MAVQCHTRRFDHMRADSLVALRVDEVPVGETEYGAVREHLVEVGVGESLRPFGLVLGVDNGSNPLVYPPTPGLASPAQPATSR